MVPHDHRFSLLKNEPNSDCPDSELLSAHQQSGTKNAITSASDDKKPASVNDTAVVPNVKL